MVVVVAAVVAATTVTKSSSWGRQSVHICSMKYQTLHNPVCFMYNYRLHTIHTHTRARTYKTVSSSALALWHFTWIQMQKKRKEKTDSVELVFASYLSPYSSIFNKYFFCYSLFFCFSFASWLHTQKKQCPYIRERRRRRGRHRLARSHKFGVHASEYHVKRAFPLQLKGEYDVFVCSVMMVLYVRRVHEYTYTHTDDTTHTHKHESTQNNCVVAHWLSDSVVCDSLLFSLTDVLPVFHCVYEFVGSVSSHFWHIVRHSCERILLSNCDWPYVWCASTYTTSSTIPVDSIRFVRMVRQGIHTQPSNWSKMKWNEWTRI